MQKSKKVSVLVLALLFTALTLLGIKPAYAAQKLVIPQVKFVTAPVTQYTVGDRVKFDISAPNYSGKVEYRVILWEDSKKAYHDLWNPGNGYSNYYYTNWQPKGNSTFTLGWPINEPGSYRITVFVKRVGIPNDKAALKGYNCDSYKESVAFVFKPLQEQTLLILDKEGERYGSSDLDKRESINGNVKVNAKNIELSNADLNGNLYISADNAVINNLSCNTIYIDPGKDGSASLTNVNAKNIVVKSGAPNSIHLNNVISESITVASSSNVRLVAEGTTKIANTYINSSSILDIKDGSLGNIKVLKSETGRYELELYGIFNEPVAVNSEAVIKASQAAKISKLVISPDNKDDIITLQGNFDTVELNKEAKISIDGNIKKLIANSKASVNTSSNTNIETLVKNQNEVVISGDGKVVEDNTAGNVPGTAGGGSSAPQPGTNTELLAVEAAGVVLSNGAVIAGIKQGTNEFYVDLSGYARNIGVKTSITLNKNCLADIMGTKFTFNAYSSRSFGPSDFGMTDNDPPGISIGNLQDNYANSSGYYTDSMAITDEANNSVIVTIRMKVK